MTKTLADMTPEEREECRGMWCEFTDFDDSDGYEYSTGSSVPQLGILVGEIGTSWECEVLTLTHGVTQFIIPEWEITPRFDLPRAWTADGEPVPGEWEDGHVFVSYDEPDPWILKDTVSIEGLSEGGMSYYEEPPNGIEVKLDQFGEGEGKARRWVGEWEKA